MSKWIEVHDNLDDNYKFFVNTDNIISIQEDVIDKSRNIVTRIDTVDKECLYVGETYEEVKELVCRAN